MRNSLLQTDDQTQSQHAALREAVQTFIDYWEMRGSALTLGEVRSFVRGFAVLLQKEEQL